MVSETPDISQQFHQIVGKNFTSDEQDHMDLHMADAQAHEFWHLSQQHLGPVPEKTRKEFNDLHGHWDDETYKLYKKVHGYPMFEAPHPFCKVCNQIIQSHRASPCNTARGGTKNCPSLGLFRGE